MPRVVIDPVARTIGLRDRVWRFEWDPAAATAAIDFGDRRYALHDLTWRQKRNLARAARKVGGREDALGALLLDACLPPRTPLPDSIEERDVLLHLAGWLVSDGQGVPLEPTTLARITLDLCRSARLTPQVLDEMSAADVEAMWAAARQDAHVPYDAPPAAASSDGFNRILILPDPAPRGSAVPQAPLAHPVERTPGADEAAVNEPEAGLSGARVSDEPVVPANTPADGSTPAAHPARPGSPAFRPAQAESRATAPRPRIRVRSIGVSPQASLRTEPDADPPSPRASHTVDAASRHEPPTPGASALGTNTRLAATAAVVPRAPESALAAPTTVSGHAPPAAEPAEPCAPVPRRAGRGAPTSATAQAVDRRAFDRPHDPFIDDGQDDPFAPGPGRQAAHPSDPFGPGDNLERAAIEAGIDLED